jgi:hypothetical protein
MDLQPVRGFQEKRLEKSHEIESPFARYCWERNIPYKLARDYKKAWKNTIEYQCYSAGVELEKAFRSLFEPIWEALRIVADFLLEEIDED